MNSQLASADLNLGRLRLRSLAVGVMALLICGIGAVFAPTQFFRAYLAAYQFFLGLGVGSLALLMIYHVTGGAWGFLLRRLLEAGMRTLPLLAVLFLPLCFGLGHLFEWANPDAIAASKDFQHKQVYLNPTFFWVRAAVYFAIWINVAYLLDAWSRRQDRTGDADVTHNMGTLSAVGLVLLGITIQFASVDWLMSLEPKFHSTMVGPLYASGQILCAHAFALVVKAWAQRI